MLEKTFEGMDNCLSGREISLEGEIFICEMNNWLSFRVEQENIKAGFRETRLNNRQLKKRFYGTRKGRKRKCMRFIKDASCRLRKNIKGEMAKRCKCCKSGKTAKGKKCLKYQHKPLAPHHQTGRGMTLQEDR